MKNYRRVICINDTKQMITLTKYNIYNILKELKDSYLIINDNGYKEEYPKYRFMEVDKK